MISVILELALIVYKWWTNPNRMKRELIRATEAAHVKAVAAFSKKVDAKDEDGVNADIDAMLDRVDRMHNDAD